MRNEIFVKLKKFLQTSAYLMMLKFCELTKFQYINIFHANLLFFPSVKSVVIMESPQVTHMYIFVKYSCPNI